MQQKNLIVPVVGDFAGPKALRAVGQYLKDHDATLAAFYVSNVEQYLTPSRSYRASMPMSATLTAGFIEHVHPFRPDLRAFNRVSRSPRSVRCSSRSTQSSKAAPTTGAIFFG